jgi:thiamine kinase-like enzyme
MLDVNVIRNDYQIKKMHGGTLGDVKLIYGSAETIGGGRIPYNVVLKTQKKWERYGDPDSWRREYDFYKSDLGAMFSVSFRWPKCYHAKMNVEENETQIWMEYIDGVSGLNLTGDMYERAAEELGRFQGKLYAEQPNVIKRLTNLSKVEFIKNYYMHYRSNHYQSKKEVHDYIRESECEIPKHLCNMLIDIDQKSDAIFNRIEKLPVVLCHRDFWVANIFYSNDSIILIDWDTSGWGYMGEDIASLIADEADVDQMIENYRKCVPAYYKGFSEYSNISHIRSYHSRANSA